MFHSARKYMTAYDDSEQRILQIHLQTPNINTNKNVNHLSTSFDCFNKINHLYVALKEQISFTQVMGSQLQRQIKH
jgi:hypothetical protein